MTPHTRTVVMTAVAVLALAAPASAGPPLLCHPYEIGTARSLPWDGTTGWASPSSTYDVRNLVADTEALLTPSTPIIVRMETLRRAAIYASGNRSVASQLLERLLARATAAEDKGRPDPLAFLDAAYVAGAFHQIAMLGKYSAEYKDRAAVAQAAVGNTDAYALIQKSVATRPNDPSIHFAAALIASDRDMALYRAHAQKARAGAHADALLAKNIDHVS